MSVLKALSNEEAAPEAVEIFDALKQKMGKVPNIYRAAGNSPKTLKAFLDYGAALKSGELSLKEVEAVALIVGELNDCHYCVNAHTVVGKGAGLSAEEMIAIRKAEIDDPKLGPLVRLTKAIVEEKGFVDSALVNDFIAAGYSKAALVDLIGLVSMNYFTNLFNHIADTEIDFPEAPAL